MSCGCSGNKNTSLSGANLLERSVPLIKIAFPLGDDLPIKGEFPVSKNALLATLRSLGLLGDGTPIPGTAELLIANYTAIATAPVVSARTIYVAQDEEDSEGGVYPDGDYTAYPDGRIIHNPTGTVYRDAS